MKRGKGITAREAKNMGMPSAQEEKSTPAVNQSMGTLSAQERKSAPAADQIRNAAFTKKGKNTPSAKEGAPQIPRTQQFLLWLVKVGGSPADIRFTMKKRSRQFRYATQVLRAVIRIVNAFDRKTIYRR